MLQLEIAGKKFCYNPLIAVFRINPNLIFLNVEIHAFQVLPDRFLFINGILALTVIGTSFCMPNFIVWGYEKNLLIFLYTLKLPENQTCYIFSVRAYSFVLQKWVNLQFMNVNNHLNSLQCALVSVPQG